MFTDVEQKLKKKNTVLFFRDSECLQELKRLIEQQKIASIIGAAIFAGRIAKPIKTIAVDTKRMSELEYVSPPVERHDEIGQLAGGVYKMYEKHKYVRDVGYCINLTLK